MKGYYAGIGSRETPPHIASDFQAFAAEIAPYWILRSGGAKGADKAFERGCISAKGKKEIFTAYSNIPDRAFEIAEEIHPNWKACSYPAKRLLTRNVLQVLGQNLDTPVSFVLCWTPDGCETHRKRTRRTGGTGQAISLASLLDIPVFNAYKPLRLQEAKEFALDEV